MKKITYFLIAAAIFISAMTAQEIPPGVRYIKASDELNGKALKKLETIFCQNPIKLNTLFGSKVVCGPQPWLTLKKENPLKDMNITPANIFVPKSTGGAQKFEGALFQSKTEITAFCTSMEKYLEADGSAFKIRKPNSIELQIYWAMIPYDITEPIFVADNKNHKLLMHFLEDGETVLWIGDFNKMHIKN
ncbi:MAG: hypothetical protein EHM45_06115 [Desulfobacteraceae bacterium]|nr:MAG: hypothetical protein EHM45_06115 [Desulfobacteraceae bacterium]